MTTSIQRIKDALNAKDLIYAAADSISDRLFEGHKASYLETIDIVPDKNEVRIQCRHWYNSGDYHDTFFTIHGEFLVDQVKIETELQNSQNKDAGLETATAALEASL